MRFALERDVAVFFSFTSNGLAVKGNEHLHLDENCLIDQIEVAWQPLPPAALVQEVFASKLGFEEIRLVPASAAQFRPTTREIRLHAALDSAKFYPLGVFRCASMMTVLSMRAARVSGLLALFIQSTNSFL